MKIIKILKEKNTPKKQDNLVQLFGFNFDIASVLFYGVMAGSCVLNVILYILNDYEWGIVQAFVCFYIPALALLLWMIIITLLGYFTTGSWDDLYSKNIFSVLASTILFSFGINFLLGTGLFVALFLVPKDVTLAMIIFGIVLHYITKYFVKKNKNKNKLTRRK